jgi:hypothetical protein
MTRADDVRELIQEQSSGPDERRTMQAVTGRLEGTLSEDVPYRPEFKADLRRRLMTEARRELTPWYRRPAVWGTSMAAAAAVAVLAVGMQLWQGGQPGTNQPLPPTPQVTKQVQPSGTKGVGVDPHLVNRSPLPVLELQPEALPAGSPGPESIAGLETVTRLNAYRVTSQADQGLFVRMAQGLGFATQGQAEGGGFRVTQGTRNLTMTADGHIAFRDTAPAPAAGTEPVDAAGAQSEARSFLDQAALPVPSQPVVLEGLVDGKQVYAVAFTPRIENRPVVNGQTVVQVSIQGRVTQADAYLQAAPEAQGPYDVVGPAEALAGVQKLGDGTWNGVDLVYARTPAQQAVFLQPYWRVYGATPQGVRMVRYVPALIPENP